MGTSPSGRHYEARVREIGRRIFARAHAAEPTIFQFGWWNQAGMTMLMEDPRTQAQLFRFVNVLPILDTNNRIVDHLRQYLDDPTLSMPTALKLARYCCQPDSLRGALLAGAARFGSGIMAKGYICGSTAQEAIQHVLKLRRRRMAFTIDILGEACTSERRADAYAEAYLKLIEDLVPTIAAQPPVDQIDRDHRGDIPRVNISVKATALYSHFDPIDPQRTIDAVAARLRPILRRARELGAFINLDVEQYAYRDLTNELFMSLLTEPEFRDWEDIGTVIQAYLTDAEDVTAELLDWVTKRGTPITIRLVKGAYWDSETLSAVRERRRIPVWTNKWESDACYERITRTLMEHHEWLHPALASHNVRSLAAGIVTAEFIGLDPQAYELQMLFGMGDPLKTAIVDGGYRLRIYTPYGDPVPGMGYLIRRLLENTSNDSFLRQGFSEGRDEDDLLSAPDEVGLRAAPQLLPEIRTQDYNDDEDPDMSAFENVPDTGFGSAENRQQMRTALAAVRGQLGDEYPLLLGGERVTTGRWFESANPSNPHEIVGRVAAAGPDEARRAVQAAQQAHAAWSHQEPQERIDTVRRIADLMQARRLELAAWICLECGKSWREADGELSEAIDYARYYAYRWQQITSRPWMRDVPGEVNVSVYRPLGVTVVIGTWSFPLALLSGMAVGAVVTGNTVVLKPASPAPVIAAKWVELLAEAGLPPGVVNYCPGPGAELEKPLCEHPDVRIIAFTGSSDTGAKIHAAAARIAPGQTSFKRTILELGGKNAIVVDDDADVDDAVKGVLASAFGYSGQKCSACSRAIVLQGVYDRFVAQLQESASSLPIGPAEEAGTVIGPVINEAARASINRFIAEGKNTARCVFQGDVAAAAGSGGYFVPPTIFADVDPQGPLAQEEIFGPVLAVIPAKDFDDAIRIANGTKYALTGGLYSRHPRHTERAKRELSCGNLYVNRKITGSLVDRQPFGGARFSGMGCKTGGPDYLLQFVEAHSIAENTLRHGIAQEEHSPIQTAHAR